MTPEPPMSPIQPLSATASNTMAPGQMMMTPELSLYPDHPCASCGQRPECIVQFVCTLQIGMLLL